MTNVTDSPTSQRYLKAIVSAVVSGMVAFLSALATALQGSSTGFDTVTAGQWITALLAFFLGLGLTGSATYRAPNAGSVDT